MVAPQRRELRHYIYGTFTFDPPTLRLARYARCRDELTTRISDEGRRIGLRFVSATYSLDPGAPSSATPILRVVTEEFDPSGEGVACSSVAAALPDDQFAQSFVALVVTPAARAVFGKDVPFTIGS